MKTPCPCHGWRTDCPKCEGTGLCDDTRHYNPPADDDDQIPTFIQIQAITLLESKTVAAMPNAKLCDAREKDL